MNILIVDDEQHIVEMLEFSFRKANFQCSAAASQKEALATLASKSFDLVLLDINLPDGNGFDICKAIRRDKNKSIPIIFLTCNDEEIDKVVAFEIGGDDYITKPFSPRELIARIKAVHRRSKPKEQEDSGSSLIAVGGLQLNLQSFQVGYKDRTIELTATEFEILRVLMMTPTKVYTRSELVDRVYQGEAVVNERTMDTHIRRIRRKFDPYSFNPIKTVSGFGYKVNYEAH